MTERSDPAAVFCVTLVNASFDVQLPLLRRELSKPGRCSLCKIQPYCLRLTNQGGHKGEGVALPPCFESCFDWRGATAAIHWNMADLEADLFGEDSDEESPQQRRRDGKAQALQQPVPSLRDDRDDESDEEEDQHQRPQRPIGPPLQLTAELVDLPARDSIRLVRLSNILGLDPKPYDSNTFQVSQEYYVDEQGTRRIKLTNQLRWREATDDDGRPIRQSNARFVQWEDGSWQLLLGDEVLDVKELDMQQDNSFLFVRHQGVIQVAALHSLHCHVSPVLRFPLKVAGREACLSQHFRPVMHLLWHAFCSAHGSPIFHKHQYDEQHVAVSISQTCISTAS